MDLGQQHDRPPAGANEGSARWRRRVAFLNSHPIQYAAPLYAFLNRSPDIEPVALYLTDFSLRGAVDRQFARKVVWDIDLLEGYEHHFVGPTWRTDTPGGFPSLSGRGLHRAIRGGLLDALVVHGHQYAADLVAMAAARLSGVPVFYKAETHLLLPRSREKAQLRRLLLGGLLSQIDGVLAVSTRNRDFYRSMGVPDEKIFWFPYTVDNDRYVSESKLDPRQRRRKRAELGLSNDRPALVYASKFMPRKHPDDLIRAAQKLTREGVKLDVVMVGAGQMEEQLRAMAAEEPQLNVYFAGFKNQTELPALLGACDIFVLPSENEPFGLIINEAMCAGLPIVASEEVGCVPDLVLNGENGFTFQAGQTDGLAAALRPLVTDPVMRTRMARRSMEIISTWDYAQNLAGLRRALGAVSKLSPVALSAPLSPGA